MHGHGEGGEVRDIALMGSTPMHHEQMVNVRIPWRPQSANQSPMLLNTRTQTEPATDHLSQPRLTPTPTTTYHHTTAHPNMQLSCIGCKPLDEN